MKYSIIDITDPVNWELPNYSINEISIFSDEWTLRRTQCINFIDSHNNQFTTKIHGRKCEVKEISNILGKEFLNNNHIQGSNNLGIVFFGLFFNQKLIGVMSLGRHSRQISQNRIVLDRFCIASGIHVNGGATKLFSRCIKWAKNHKYDEIISFSDNRLTDGKIYEIMGFSLEKNHKADYYYVDTKNSFKRLSKQSQKKSTVNCPENMTELEWAEFRGLKRIYDMGKKRWVYPIDPEALLWKEKLSAKCAKQNQMGDFKHSHIRGYYKSIKCNSEIYYGSSYELRCMFLLENNPLVKYYNRAETFLDSDNKSRNPDLQVKYNDNSIAIIEVKPKGRLKEEAVKKQIEETYKFSISKGYRFFVWTEKDSELKSDHHIIDWAKKFIAKTTGNTFWIERQLENNRRKANKFYNTHISPNKIEIFCEYCKEIHTPLKLTYNKNITRNKRYICEKEGGHIAGSLPKPHLIKENPYKEQGKKECLLCKQILIFENFGKDKSRRDGYSDKCKECRSKIAKNKYNEKKNIT